MKSSGRGAKAIVLGAIKADLLWLIALLLFLLVSQLVFIQRGLENDAKSFAQSFRRTHLLELTSGDISALTVRLSSYASEDSLSSLEIRFNGAPYFQIHKDRQWKERFLTEQLQMNSGDGAIQVRLAFRASRQKISDAITFFIVESSLLGLLFLTALLWERKRHQEKEKFQDLMVSAVHDMKPALAALNVATSDVLSPADQRELILSAGKSLSQVSASLLGAWRSQRLKTSLTFSEEAAPNSGRDEITLWLEESQLNLSGRGLVLEISQPWTVPSLSLPEELTGMLRRTLGNIISNSIEAGSKRIRISGRLSGGLFLMSLEDDGSGIPESIFGNLGKSPITCGKPDGNGIGVFSAFEFMERIGGVIDFTRLEPNGTRVILGFPSTT